MSTAIATPEVRITYAERFNFAPDATHFNCRFLEPGLVSYRDQGGGIELLRKETIDRCISSAIGNPITINHITVTHENRLEVENGIVEAFEYNGDDGWYYVNGTINTTEAKSHIRRGWRPSCAYAVREFGPGGTYHGIKYDREIVDIEFQHLAIVERPRYEGASFRLNAITNSQPGDTMFKFLKKIVTRLNGADGKPTEATEVKALEVSGDTEVVIDGVSVRLNDLAKVWKTQAGQVFEASGDDEIEIDGKPVKMNELVSCYQNSTKKNAAPPETPEDKLKRENAAEAEAADKLKRENAAAAETEAADKLKRENAAAEKAKNAESFFTLRAARENASVSDEAATLTNSGSILDRVKAGQSRYGSAPVVVTGKN